MNLDELVALYAEASSNASEGYASATHAGVAAVLQAVADEGQRLAARSVEVYDNRLVYQLAAELNRAAKPHA